MGTAEIYRAVLALDEVVDALVVDLPREGDAGLHAAVRRAPRRRRARRRPRRRGSASASARTARPRHVPDEIRAIAEVPRTLSGKVLEVPVKRILMRRARRTRALSRDSLANPDALRPFEELAATPEWRNA